MSRAQYYHLSGVQLRDLRAEFPNLDIFLINDTYFRQAARRLGLNPRNLLVAMRRDRTAQLRRRWITLGRPVAQATAADEAALVTAYGKTSAQLAAEAERGYEVTAMRPRARS